MRIVFLDLRCVKQYHDESSVMLEFAGERCIIWPETGKNRSGSSFVTRIIPNYRKKTVG
jgi:hypothetical protein